MQATVRTSGFGFGSLKVALVAAVLLATTIAGSAAITLTDDGAVDSTAPVASDVETVESPRQRIAERNAANAVVEDVIESPRQQIAERHALSRSHGTASVATQHVKDRYLGASARPAALDHAQLTSLKYAQLESEAR